MLTLGLIYPETCMGYVWVWLTCLVCFQSRTEDKIEQFKRAVEYYSIASKPSLFHHGPTPFPGIYGVQCEIILLHATVYNVIIESCTFILCCIIKANCEWNCSCIASFYIYLLCPPWSIMAYSTHIRDHAHYLPHISRSAVWHSNCAQNISDLFTILLKSPLNSQCQMSRLYVRHFSTVKI